MINTIFIFFENLIRTTRIADLLDVALISAFLYIFISWLRWSTSKRAILAVSILSGVYILARILEMYMTQLLIETLFVLFLIAAVVVFQSDIRRLVEWLGTWNLSRKNNTQNLPETLSCLPEIAEKLATSYTGALIAIKGHDAWDLQIEGGIDLNGLASRPLLYSIFDNQTPGHDGAVLIEGDRITKFAAHLPLSTNQERIGERGTRHAAALGLSEQCDAMVIVVSEERGVISVAEQGQLVELPSAKRLQDRLEWFWKRHRERHADQKHQWYKQNLQTTLLSVSLAVFFWLIFVFHSETVFRTYVVPIEFRNLQSSMGLEDPLPVEARITLTGSEQAFRLLDPRGLIISFDLAKFTEGANKLTITRDNLKLPSELSLHHVDPPVIPIKAYRFKSVQLPISIKTTGSLPDSLLLTGISATPKTVTLLLPEQEAKKLSQIPTTPIPLPRITRSTHQRTPLVLPDNARLQPGQSSETTIYIDVRSKRQK